jgi:hypothetical protein
MSKKYVLLSIAVHIVIVGLCFRSRPLDIFKRTTESMRKPIHYVDNVGVIDFKKIQLKKNQNTALPPIVVQKIKVSAPRTSEIELIVEAYGIPVDQLL